jgi:hypothetical protein
MVNGEYLTDAQIQKEILEGQGYTVDELTIKAKTVQDNEGNDREIHVWYDENGREVKDIEKYLKNAKETLWDSEGFSEVRDKLKGYYSSSFTLSEM